MLIIPKVLLLIIIILNAKGHCTSLNIINIFFLMINDLFWFRGSTAKLFWVTAYHPFSRCMVLHTRSSNWVRCVTQVSFSFPGRLLFYNVLYSQISLGSTECSAQHEDSARGRWQPPYSALSVNAGIIILIISSSISISISINIMFVKVVLQSCSLYQYSSSTF